MKTFEFEPVDIDELDLDNKIYADTEIAMNIAKQLDINLGKTTLSEILKGYTDSLVLQRRIDRAIEELELWEPKIEAFKIERDYLLDVLRGKDDYLLDVLRGEKQ